MGEKKLKDEIQFLEALHVSDQRFLVTPSIIGINVLIFILMTLSGVSLIDPTVEEMFNWGANYGPYTLSGEWLRLFTSTFIHYGIIHLAFNMWVLWELGNLAERLFGNWIFLILYFFCGIGGSVVSVWWNPEVVSMGASGAVFGVVGGLIIFWYDGDFSVPQSIIKKKLNSLMMFTAYNLFYGFTESGIDNAAHLGGLALGLFLGIMFKRPLPPVKAQSRLPHYLGMLGAIILIIMGATLARENMDESSLIWVAGNKFHEKGEYVNAIIEYKKALEIDPANSAIHHDLGVSFLGKELYDEAKASFKQAIEFDPKADRTYFLLGLILVDQGFYKDATISMRKSIEINPDLLDVLNEIIQEDPRMASVAGMDSLYIRMAKKYER